MGWFTSALRGAASVAGAVTKIPFAGNILKAIPVVGTVASVGSLAYEGYKLATGGGGNGNTGVGGGFPGQPGPGDRSVLRNDPNVSADLKNQVISMAGLRQFYRAPKGFVIRRDEKGDPMGVPKHLARRMGWRPAHKPLLTGGQMNSIRKAEGAIKHLQKVGKDLRFIHTAMHPHHDNSAIKKAIDANYRVLETKALLKGK